jgi:hypothetical protein
VVLQIGNHVYPTARVGGSGTVKAVDWMIFKIHNQNEAKVAAKWLSVDCALRTPLEPKFSAQFIPAKSEFHTNEPVLVNFVMTNLDDRTITFENAGPARFQYDFQAMLNGRRVSEIKVDDLMPFNGSIFLVNLEPGKEFDRHVDLKGWFAFNKVGTYKIHGSSDLKFFNKSGDTAESHQMWKVMWNGNASTDFTVVVK